MLNWTADIKSVISKIRQRSGLLKRLHGRFKNCSKKTLRITYKAFVRPLIDFRAVTYASARKHFSFLLPAWNEEFSGKSWIYIACTLLMKSMSSQRQRHLQLRYMERKIENNQLETISHPATLHSRRWNYKTKLLHLPTIIIFIILI